MRSARRCRTPGSWGGRFESAFGWCLGYCLAISCTAFCFTECAAGSSYCGLGCILCRSALLFSLCEWALVLASVEQGLLGLRTFPLISAVLKTSLRRFSSFEFHRDQITRSAGKRLDPTSDQRLFLYHTTVPASTNYIGVNPLLRLRKILKVRLWPDLDLIGLFWFHSACVQKQYKSLNSMPEFKKIL